MPLSGSSLLKGCETEMGVGDVDKFHSVKNLVGMCRHIMGVGQTVKYNLKGGSK